MNLGRKVVLVVRKTRLQELIAQYNTESQARFVVESRGGDFQDYCHEHTAYNNALASVEHALEGKFRVQRLERTFLCNFMFNPDDIIVVLGQDGLVANALKYLHGQPVVAVNPEPARYDGVLLPFSVNEVLRVVKNVVMGRFQSRAITMAQARLDDGQQLLAVNDFFIGPRLPISARYQLSMGDRSEMQSSSGVIVSTGLGSTGWLKSVFAGAAGVLGLEKMPNTAFDWSLPRLQFVVREPFQSKTTGTDWVAGEIPTNAALTLHSQMANHGVIFSDGMVDDYLMFNSGTTVQIQVADRQGHLVIGGAEV